jgi:hypothetical protein
MFKNHLFDILMALAFMAAVGFTISIGSAPSQLGPSVPKLSDYSLRHPDTTISVNTIDQLVPSASTTLRVYQYDPDSDAFTWFQFPRQAPDQAAASTTSRVYQYDPDSDAFTWLQFPSQAPDK